QVVSLSSALFLADRKYVAIPFGSDTPDPVVVEVAGFTARDGIYFVPRGTTPTSLLVSLSWETSPEDEQGLNNEPLRDGVVIRKKAGGGLGIGEMSAATKLALGIPLDINKVSLRDLILIPGVKGATAAAILAFRDASGGRIRTMDDLLRIRGIKEKRLAVLKRYLFVSPR
ncbi:MAG: helix-hairpin-helix domain-containing protein, partial [Syntrophales bacterium]|nr:helix-hairpin-helix domain-containing protein [Syntrophales bacterium]